MQNSDSTQNSDPSRKWLDLQGLAVVTIDVGKKVGTLDDFYFDPETNIVPAISIKTGLFGHRALMSGEIKSIGIDAITFSGEDMLIEGNGSDQLRTLPMGRTLLSYRVLSEGGTVVGSIGNIFLDTSNPTTIRVTAFELSGGIKNRISGRYPTFSSSRIARYGQDVLVIPDAVAQSLIER